MVIKNYTLRGIVDNSISNKDVLLVYPPGQECKIPALGFLYLAAVLEGKKFSVGILDASIENLSLSHTLETIKKMQPRIIGISTWTSTYSFVRKFVFILKHFFNNVTIVLGGPHVTACPEETLNETPADFAVIGEGEYTFLELCGHILGNNSISLHNIKGIAYKEGGKIIKTGNREFIKNLDDLPLPARHLIPFKKYRNYGHLAKQLPSAEMITSRGCPFPCIFCGDVVFGRRYRVHSAEKVLEECEHLMKYYGIRDINFQDSNFVVDQERLVKFCEGIIRKKWKLSWVCQADINSANRNLDILSLMKKAGCWMIGYGVESGSPEILQVIRKKVNLEKAKNVFISTRKAGIMTIAYLQIGNLEDNQESIERTVAYAKSLHTDIASFAITTPFPGTELWDRAIKLKYVEEISYNDLKVPTLMEKNVTIPLRTKYLSGKELLSFQRNAIRNYYFRPSQMLRLLFRTRTITQFRYLFSFALTVIGRKSKSLKESEKVRKEILSMYENIVSKKYSVPSGNDIRDHENTLHHNNNFLNI